MKEKSLDKFLFLVVVAIVILFIIYCGYKIKIDKTEPSELNNEIVTDINNNHYLVEHLFLKTYKLTKLPNYYNENKLENDK